MLRLIMPWRSLVRRRVLINLKSGKALAGILWQRRGPLLVLREATLFEAADSGRGLDGDVVVERGDVDFYQFTETR